MMKKICLSVLLVLALLLTGCASAPAEPPKVENFVFDDHGYASAIAPYGCTLEDLEKALDTTMTDRGSNPVTNPFTYESYITSAPVTMLGLEGKVDAQFTEDGLFAFTFTTRFARDTAEERYADIREQFISVFGKPAEDSDNGLGTQQVEWQDKKSGTALALVYSDLGTTDPTFMVGVFEKWRYMDVDEW